MPLANCIECLIRKEFIVDFSDTSDRGVGDWNDVLRKHESHELVLGHCRIQLNLVTSWFVAGVTKKICEHLKIEVGHSNAFDETSIDKLLKLAPEHVNWYPVGRVFLPKTCWPVNQIQIDVFDFKLG